MMSFSPDPQVAEQQMHAVIFYLTAFGYIDGHFDGNERRFVIAKLKLRCFELFKGFDEEGRARLIGTVDELMHADGSVHPAEAHFREELFRLLRAPIELAEAELEHIEEGSVLIGDAREIRPRKEDHPFFQRTEWNYASDKA